MPRLLLILLSFIANIAFGQKEASVWYFGHNAGLDFNSGSPVILTNGQIHTDEGVASICDTDGQLLFYTEGTKVWNREHTVMPNGSDLLGNFSSSQSAIIVPKINDPGKYYIFTIAQLGGPDGFNYSIVNMALDGGKGDIELKNVRLQNQVCEKLTAVRHCNGKDIWVIVHGFNAATFHAYLVTTTGVNTTPVVSTAGRIVPSNDPEFAIGCMKVSPNGKKLAMATRRIAADLFDFDNSTGIVANGEPIFLPAETYGTYRGAYGVEFSPNSKYLYIAGDFMDFSGPGESSYLLQYNVSLSDHPSIQASKKILYQQRSHWSTDNFGTLQMAPDGKMYMAALGQPFISVINFPDLEGTACQFVYGGTITNHTGGGWSRYGLPSFIQSFFRNTYSFRGACSGNLLKFDYEMASNEVSVKWDFGDPASGANNTSTLDSTEHLFSAEGIFSVKLIRFTACGSDTILKNVNVGAGQVNLGKDTTFCGLTQHTIIPQLTGSNNTFLWQDGSAGADFNATQNGLYWVEVTNTANGCKKRDSVNLAFKPDPSFSLGIDQNKCEGDIVNLGVNLPATFLWNNGATNSSQQITQTGIYWLDVTLDGCTKRDSISITYYNYPSIDLGDDISLCEGVTRILDAENPGMQYRWQNNTTNQTYLVNGPGTYSVIINNNGCTATDAIKIDYINKPDFTLGLDTSICQGMTIVLSPDIKKGTDLTYNWNTGSSDVSIPVMQEGVYSLTLTNQCGTQSDNIQISKGICTIYVPTAFTPNNDGLNDTFRALYGDNLTSFELTIYNRWGEVIFKSNDIKRTWNGNYKGQPQDSGIYPWIIRYKTINETTLKLLKGTVLLAR